MAGCAQEVAAPSDSETGATPAFANLDEKLARSAEGQRAVQLAKLMAKALDDAEVRTNLKRAMRNAPFLEHKLSVGSYLRSQSGGRLLSAMASSPDVSPTDVLALLDGIRPMEMYFPVDKHRETWTGDASVVVATLLDDHTIPAGYRTTGAPYAFSSAETAPTVPVLAIVPVETNFDHPIKRSNYRNVDRAGGEAIGSYQRLSGQAAVSSTPCLESVSINSDCTPGGGGGGGGYTSPWANRPTGLYLTKIYIPDDHEGAFKGDPEFETHLQAPGADPSLAEDLWCAGERADDVSGSYSVYNQDNALWTGAVMVADSAEQATFVSRYGDASIGMGIISWEDDDTACEIKADEDRFTNMMVSIAQAYDPVTSALQDPDSMSVMKALPFAENAVFSFASWLKSNDDVVGSRVEAACSFPDGTTGNWVIKDGTTTTGCSVLRAHDQQEYVQ